MQGTKGIICTQKSSGTSLHASENGRPESEVNWAWSQGWEEITTSPITEFFIEMLLASFKHIDTEASEFEEIAGSLCKECWDFVFIAKWPY